MNKLILLFLLFSAKLYSQNRTPVCAEICNSTSDSLTVDEILECGELLPTDTNYYVRSFWLSTSQGENHNLVSGNNEITEQMEKNISKLKPGDKIIFDNIKIANKSGIIKWGCALKIVIN